MMNDTELETDRLILRVPKAEDTGPWTRFFLSERARSVGGGGGHDEATAWRVFSVFAGHWTLRGFGPFIMVLKSRQIAIGAVGPWYPQGWPEPELTWSLWDACWEGQGFVTEAMTLVRRHVSEVMGWTTAVSYIEPGNIRSMAVARRLGGVVDADAPNPDDDPSVVFRYRLKSSR